MSSYESGRMKSNRAVFLDRDGVINELVYSEEHGLLDSPASVDQLKMLPWVGEAVRQLQEGLFRVVLVSNQPGIAKGQLTMEAFVSIRERMDAELQRENASLDGEYYCFHHPNATVDTLRGNCGCRKPKPGLLIEAASDMSIDLASSWMIGDGITDIQAGKAAGCSTVLIGRMKCELCDLMDEMEARPDAIAPNLLEATAIVLQSGVSRGGLH